MASLVPDAWLGGFPRMLPNPPRSRPTQEAPGPTGPLASRVCGRPVHPAGRAVPHPRPSLRVRLLGASLLSVLCFVLPACHLTPKVVTTKAVAVVQPSRTKNIPVYWVGSAPYVCQDPHVETMPAFEMRMGKPPAHWIAGWPERPFHIIGVVSATHLLPRNKGMVKGMFEKGAQRLGADLLVGAHITSGQEIGWCCTALAAKYNLPGQEPPPVTQRSVVVMNNEILPAALRHADRGFKRWAAMFAGGWSARLGRDGYYVTPPRDLANADKVFDAIRGHEAYSARIRFRPCQVRSNATPPMEEGAGDRTTAAVFDLQSSFGGDFGPPQGIRSDSVLQNHKIDFGPRGSGGIWITHDMPPGLHLTIAEGESWRGFLVRYTVEHEPNRTFLFLMYGGEDSPSGSQPPLQTFPGTDFPAGAFTGKGFLPVIPFYPSPSKAPRIGQTK